MPVSEKQLLMEIRSLIPSKRFLRELVEEVLTRGQDSESEAHSFYQACLHSVRTEGFRRGSKRPISLMLPNCVRVLEKHDSPFLHFIVSLLALEKENAQKIRRLAEEAFGESVWDPPETAEEFHNTVKVTMARAREELGVPWDDERLRFFTAAAVTVRVTDVEEEESAADLEIPSMMQVLEIISAIEPDDPFWTHFDVFLEKAEAIREEKQDHNHRKQKSDAALHEFKGKYADILNDFFCMSIEGWSSDSLLGERCSQVLDDLPKLGAALQKHQEISVIRPSNVREAQDIRNQLSQLEEEITALWRAVDACFEQSAGDAEEETDSEPHEHRESNESDVSETVEEPLDESDSAVEDAPQPEVASTETIELQTEEAVTAVTESLPDKSVPEEKTQRIEPNQEENTVLQMIVEGDLAGAYWLAKAHEERGEILPVPPWLIAAMESSRYLLLPGFRLARDFTFPTKYYLHDADPQAELCAVGVGLIASLLEPTSNAMLWLFPQDHLPNLQRIIEVVRSFSKDGISLSRRDLLSISNQEQRELMIAEAARRCREITAVNSRRKFGLPRVNRIWKKLFAEGEELRTALDTIGADERSARAVVREVIAAWSTTDQIVERIKEIDAMLMRKKDKPIADYERDRLIRIVLEVVGAAEEWLLLVEHSDLDRNDWKQVQITKLRTDFDAYLEPCLAELDAAISNSGSESIGLRYIKDNLLLLQSYMEGTVSRRRPDISWAFQQSDSIEEVMAKRLLWCPELDLQDNALPTKSDLSLLPDCLGPEPNWAKLSEEHYLAWLKKQDHRFLDQILDALDSDGESKEELRERAAKELQGSRDSLQEQIRENSIKIEAALVNGVLTEEQRSEFAAQVESIDVSTTLNFAQVFRKLSIISAQLHEQVQNRIEHLQKIWSELSPRLEEIASAEEAEQARNLVKKAFDAADTRVVDEYIAHVRDHLERNEPLALTAEKEQVRDYLKEFSEFRHVLMRSHSPLSAAHRAARDGKSWLGLQYGNISTKQLEQTNKAFEAWRSLGNRRKGTLTQSITDLFTFLGYTITEPVREQSFPPESSSHLHLTIHMTASDQARPFQQFGSRFPTFDVLMVWERPGADNLGTAVKEAKLGRQGTIVLYFGRIGELVRREITRMTRRQNLPLAILDETLFLFLTGERDAHLRAFLRCSVPYGTAIPYTPQVMGDVPSEMFYGREKVASMLLQRDGSCIVYGGRQMGKSALLRSVRRQAHNPERRQFAWIEDVKTLGDSYSNEEPSKIWSRLWDHLYSEGLVSGKMPNDDEIIRRVEQLLKKDQTLQIILMLDEADNFLNYDASEEFRVVSQFRRLMTDSERRFKVIFAGLQHVQRFQSMPNQPLAHFGAPILVGPLEEEAAVKLVREPLVALGFELDDACVYRILSFTNYHPGLIQFFCYYLLERLYSKHEVLPSPFRPIKITKEDVEYIYLQDDVRNRIRERFEWTLALDPRYQVIVWAMIVAQMETRDSFSREFTVGQLFSMAREFWPAEFNDVSSDEFRGLLRELVGLGVLASPGGQYRLKSPNLVRIMGDHDDIADRLLSFVDEPARKEIETDSFHEQIDEKSQLYSVFTYEQARNIDREQDFRVVTASSALGLDIVEESIKHLYASDEQVSFRRMSISVTSAEDLLNEVEKARNRTKKNEKEHVVLYQIVDQPQVSPIEVIKAAYRYYQSSQNKRRRVSFFFALNPQTYWDLRQDDPDFVDLLDEEGYIIGVQTWNHWGIRQRLDNESKLSTDEIRTAIIDAGGSWPYLLDEIMHLTGTDKDVQVGAQEVRHRLMNDEDYRQLFLNKIQLPSNPAVHAVLELLVSEEEPIPLELITPSYGEPLNELTDKHCEDAILLLKQFEVIDLEDGDLIVLDPTVRMVLSRS